MFPWVYRGEGNQHIVISDEKKHIVYRMFKRIRNGEKKMKIDYEVLRSRLERCLEFTSNIMLPLFGSQYLHCGSLVEIPESTASVIKSCLINRPSYREDKELDISCPYALQIPDYCYVNQRDKSTQSANTSLLTNKPVYTVEIKPKWGFLPATKFISKSRCIKYSVCRFCMHQHFKLAKGKWKLHTHYCPLDLFSGDVARMKHALRMLFNVPQNNLRLFKNGRIIWNDVLQEKYGSPDLLFLNEFADSSTMDITSVRSQFDDFLDLLAQILLHQFNDESQSVTTHPQNLLNRNVPLHNASKTGTAVIIQNDATHMNGTSRSGSNRFTQNGLILEESEINFRKSDSEGCYDSKVVMNNYSKSNNKNPRDCCVKNNFAISSESCNDGLSVRGPDRISRPVENVKESDINEQRNHNKSCNGHNWNDLVIYAETCKESTYIKKEAVRKVSLPKGSVLYQVLRTQRLDALDIEGIMPLYKLVKTTMQEIFNSDNSNPDPYHFNGPYNAGWWCPNVDNKSTDCDQLSYAVQKIKEYLVSRSAKDCSIMISLQQCSPSQDMGYNMKTADSSTAHALNPKPTSQQEKQLPPVVSYIPDTETILTSKHTDDRHRDRRTSANSVPVMTTEPLTDEGSENIINEDGSDHTPSMSKLKFPTDFTVKDPLGTSYKAVVGVIDLDPKGFDKIPQYMVEDEEIVKCYLSYLHLKTSNPDKQ